MLTTFDFAEAYALTPSQISTTGNRAEMVLSVDMLQQLFEKQRRYLDYFFDRLDFEIAESFFEICQQCEGMILFCGVGKSGLVAEKIAMTLVSTGTKALYLPPTNLLHGDLGIISRKDVFVMVSKSGETEELLDLIPFVRRRGATLLGIVSNSESRLAKACDLSISLPLEKELCPFDLAPTTSTVIQLIFGDVLAVALMEAKEFTLEDYALNHPSGLIGKKLTVTVADMMMTGEKLPLCKPEELLVDVLPMLSDKRCGCLLVVDEERHLLGIFTDGDLRRSLQAQGAKVLDRPMGELMTPSALWATKDLLAWEALKMMQKDPKKWILVLPVLHQGKVIGILRLHDIIHMEIAP